MTATESNEQVILVDASDNAIGTAGKMEAHLNGALHRAFSIFIMDSDGRMLLQRRASGKYHTPGLWSNTCCGHPRPGEDVAVAARRRLGEEMGFQCALVRRYGFVYTAELENGLGEHEYDHVFVGTFEGVPQPDELEVSDWKWDSPAAIASAMDLRPADYTPWFRIALPELMSVDGLLDVESR
ncbi:MAG: isopentenyl-diphosphate Delta-isomerase [Gemmatimonadaceae bacterium]